jgi:hypothetical protein
LQFCPAFSLRWLAEEAAAAEHEAAVSQALGGRQVKSTFWLCFEAIHCAVLLAAVVLLFDYVFYQSKYARFNST